MGRCDGDGGHHYEMMSGRDDDGLVLYGFLWLTGAGVQEG